MAAGLIQSAANQINFKAPHLIIEVLAATEIDSREEFERAIKDRSLLIKYQEYLPLGLEPVVIHVT